MVIRQLQEHHLLGVVVGNPTQGHLSDTTMAISQMLHKLIQIRTSVPSVGTHPTVYHRRNIPSSRFHLLPVYDPIVMESAALRWHHMLIRMMMSFTDVIRTPFTTLKRRMKGRDSLGITWLTFSI